MANGHTSTKRNPNPLTENNHFYQTTMHPNYYHGHPFGGYANYRRGPSRFWWFLLGAGALATWNYWQKPESERRRFGWRRDRCLKGREDEYAAEATRGRKDDTSAMTTQATGSLPRDDTRHEENWGAEPLWRLRSEKEAERLKAIREMEVREQLLNAREKVLHATENGLETLRQSLDSLTRMVQEQRKDTSSRERSPEKKD